MRWRAIRQGEIAAACVAGVLSLEDAAMVVALRSRALAALAGRGGDGGGGGRPRARCGSGWAAWAGRLSVAAVNGPATVVVSGPAGAVEALVAELAGAGVCTRRLAVDYASHCGQVEVVEQELRRRWRGWWRGARRVAFVSAVTGGRLDRGGWMRGTGTAVCGSRSRSRRPAGAWLAEGTGCSSRSSPHPVLAGAAGRHGAAGRDAGCGDRVAAP